VLKVEIPAQRSIYRVLQNRLSSFEELKKIMDVCREKRFLFLKLAVHTI
jgi:hypothetical protein